MASTLLVQYYYSIACVELFIMASIDAYNMLCDTVFCKPCAHVTKNAEDHQVQNDGAYCCFVRLVLNYVSI